jgi:hypothetical protein
MTYPGLSCTNPATPPFSERTPSLSFFFHSCLSIIVYSSRVLSIHYISKIEERGERKEGERRWQREKGKRGKGKRRKGKKERGKGKGGKGENKGE